MQTVQGDQTAPNRSVASEIKRYTMCTEYVTDLSDLSPAQKFHAKV